MTTPIPAWARALLLADRAVHSSVRLAALVRTELLLAGLSTAEREAVNAAVFSAEDTYSPGGPTFAHGLFAWEREAFATAPFPPSGRVLLGGGGGGRELTGLCALGYEVVAFEPAPALSEALIAVAAKHPRARALRGSYADLVLAARGGGGPLGSLLGERYDAVVLGWASLSHVTDAAERASLLAALRSLAPGAPVLLSYLGPDDDGRANGRVERLRAPLRRWLSRAAGRAAAAEGEGFVPGAGFYQRYTPEEIEALASAAGYELAMHEREPYPHALLAPRSTVG
ncbi:MAG: class I SAM-dependent methyltransferase [Myxococcaceae bacterium]|nr:MAG: class I SAM-dependent methyltransferase [Myxococcaceae bacterium]